MNTSERFLQEFHRQHPGCTPAAFTNGYTDEGLTSYDKLVQTVYPSAAGANLLDLACGDGFLLKKLRNSFPHLVLSGVDMSAGELEAAQKNLSTADVTLFEGKAQHLPFPPFTFDFILCHMAFMLMDDIDQVVSEIRRCLKPAGVFAAIIGGNFNHDPVFKSYRSLLDEALTSEGKTWLKGIGCRISMPCARSVAVRFK